MIEIDGFKDMTLREQVLQVYARLDAMRALGISRSFILAGADISLPLHAGDEVLAWMGEHATLLQLISEQAMAGRTFEEQIDRAIPMYEYINALNARELPSGHREG